MPSADRLAAIKTAVRARQQQALRRWRQGPAGQGADDQGRALVLGELTQLEPHGDTWCHGWVQADSGGVAIPVAGPLLPGLATGVLVRLVGHWETREGFGERFVFTALETRLPTEPAAVARYLKRHVKGLGETRAMEVAIHLGPEALSRLVANPDAVLACIPGKAGQTVAEGVRAWSTAMRAEQVVQQLVVEFLTAGLTESAARKAIRQLGPDEAEAVVRLNPYRLVQVAGIGFRTADAVALKQGMSVRDPARLVAGLAWTLETAKQEGDCALQPAELLKRAEQALRLTPADHPRLEAALAAALAPTPQGEAALLDQEEDLVYLPELRVRELFIAHALARLAARRQLYTGGIHTRLDALIQAQGLAPLQRDGVWRALEHGVSILTGRPGTGKTTTVRTILLAAQTLGWHVALCAPTGKAASRASEVCGHPASTIHRLLQVPPYQRRRTPLEADLVILDEASMADLDVTAWLLDNLDPTRTRLVLVGDDNQLPSVGPGRVLGDLIDSGRLPVTQLKEIFRQAQGSRIITNAHALLDLQRMDLSNTTGSDFLFADVTDIATSADGTPLLEDPERSGREQRLGQQRIVRAIQHLVRDRGAHPLRDIQVLTPMRRGLLGADELNQVLQDALNPHGAVGPTIGGQQVVRVGDRILQTKNNYTLRLFNGDQLEVVAVDAAAKRIEARIDGEIRVIEGPQLQHVRLAWAMTVHRAQGSEFPYTILAYHTSHHMLLSLNLLYTAITRAKRQFICVGTGRAIQMTYVEARRATPRVTGLVRRLQQLIAQPAALEMSV